MDEAHRGVVRQLPQHLPLDLRPHLGDAARVLPPAGMSVFIYDAYYACYKYSLLYLFTMHIMHVIYTVCYMRSIIRTWAILLAFCRIYDTCYTCYMYRLLHGYI